MWRLLCYGAAALLVALTGLDPRLWPLTIAPAILILFLSDAAGRRFLLRSGYVLAWVLVGLLAVMPFGLLLAAPLGLGLLAVTMYRLTWPRDTGTH